MSNFEKLKKLAEQFMEHVRNEQWQQAKECYVNAIMRQGELTESEYAEIFGIREDKGVIAKQGMFPEDLVIKVGDMCTFGFPTYSNQKKKEIERENMKKRRQRRA